MTTHFSQSRIAWIAPLALALVFTPAAASAQATPRKTTAPATKAPAPPATKAPAPALHRAPSAAPSAPADAALIGRLEYQGSLGLAVPFESGLNAGFKLAAGGFYGLQTLQPGLVLQVGGIIGWTYNGYSGLGDASLNTFDLLPVARLRMALQPRIFVYGDGGLGLAIVRSKVTVGPFFPGGPSVSSSSTDAALLIKLGGGIGYELQPNLSLTFEPAFNIYVKSGSITQFTMLVGAIYRP